jgi:hypothetical protein
LCSFGPKGTTLIVYSIQHRYGPQLDGSGLYKNKKVPWLRGGFDSFAWPFLFVRTALAVQYADVGIIEGVSRGVGNNGARV